MENSIEIPKEYLETVKNIKTLKKVLWINSHKKNFSEISDALEIKEEEIKDAEERLKRFAPYLIKAFPETKSTNGIIESPLIEIPKMKSRAKEDIKEKIYGKLYIKCDNQLPIAGSIKARGGIYEVLKRAEDLALKNGLIKKDDDYSKFYSDEFKNFFSDYTIQVGSTGNLGLSIGIMSAQLGFKVKVHMSADAKQWKKELLRSKGVNVVEYSSDYSKAVEEGRKLSNEDPKSMFIDDENSKDLFLGYAVGAFRLREQLKKMNIPVDRDHPLFVYLPCGVGGGPGGIAYGLKLIYKDNAHLFFAEPTHSPAMLLGLITGLHNQISVKDFGLDNKTEADGLAVGRPSGLVGKIMDPILDGEFTVEDNQLYRFLAALAEEEKIYLEPSALAGFPGPALISKEYGEEYLKNSTHICWATGGSLVPDNIMKGYYEKGKLLNNRRK
ncbi:D-serine ammonia-lyase [Sporanaerobacter sp. PP17-6a]|uniref:D-serine ammonia-lyase n=1 Tax=Sporanaerobacter sp. PP17-6a TaxID=1891289 RepID=UPI0008A0946B|nr:D-serine ammonia-lyase [Sporanaerobacter sp. PP17-6a]SCL85728.1 D-serine dehydratase [Sporanaerobacter sp. PP17-6a]